MAEFGDFGIAIAVFIAVTLIVGIFAGKLVRNSGKRLIVAGKSLPLALVGTMLAAQAVDGNSTLGNAALVFEFGFWAGAITPIGLGMCLLVVAAFYGKPLNKMSMITLPDFYFRRFGNGAEGISGVLMIISFIILVAGNLAASGFILETVFGIDYFWGILITALVVVAYTMTGGLFASAYTNLFQVYLAIGAFWAGFLFFAGGFADAPWNVIYSSAPPEFLDLSGLFDVANGALINWAGLLALGLGDIIALDFMERVFAAKNPKTAQRGALMGGLLTMFTVVPTTMMGIIAYHYLAPGHRSQPCASAAGYGAPALCHWGRHTDGHRRRVNVDCQRGTAGNLQRGVEEPGQQDNSQEVARQGHDERQEASCHDAHGAHTHDDCRNGPGLLCPGARNLPYPGV